MGSDVVMERQYGILALFMALAFKVSMLPAVLFGVSGRDVWVTIGVFAVLELMSLCVIVGVEKLGGLEKIKRVCGKPLYCILLAPFLFNVVVKVSVYLAEVNAYVCSYMFYNIAEEGVCAVFMIFTVYCAARGAKCLARLSELTLWIVPVIIIVGVIFGRIDLEPESILPVLADGADPVWNALDKYLFWGFDLTPLLFFRRREEGGVPALKRSRVPWLPISGGVYLVIIVGLYLVFVMNYGGGGGLVGFAFSSLGAFSMVNTEIGSLDWPAIMLWQTVSVIAVAVKIYAGARVAEEIKINRTVAVTAIGIICYILAITVFENTSESFAFATGAVRYVVTGINLGVPILFAAILLSAKIAESRQRARGKLTEAKNEA